MTSLTTPERDALLDHLAEQEGSETDLDRHIRDGGTLASYIADWKRARDERARAGEPTDEYLDRALNAPLEPYGTVRDYLTQLLASFWAGKADQHYGMTGNSDWRYDVYEALLKAGLIPGWRDGYGLDRDDQIKADNLIFAAMARMTGGKLA